APRKRMASDRLFPDVDAFAKRLSKLRAQRRRIKIRERQRRIKLGEQQSLVRRKRKSLTPAERDEILTKSDRRCHICGGLISDKWQADHVWARSTGGKHLVDNYLAAHSLCNNYRWDYGSEEFQWILKIGVFMRTQIENKRPIGRD